MSEKGPAPTKEPLLTTPRVVGTLAIALTAYLFYHFGSQEINRFRPDITTSPRDQTLLDTPLLALTVNPEDKSLSVQMKTEDNLGNPEALCTKLVARSPATLRPDDCLRALEPLTAKDPFGERHLAIRLPIDDGKVQLDGFLGKSSEVDLIEFIQVMAEAQKGNRLTPTELEDFLALSGATCAGIAIITTGGIAFQKLSAARRRKLLLKQAATGHGDSLIHNENLAKQKASQPSLTPSRPDRYPPVAGMEHIVNWTDFSNRSRPTPEMIAQVAKELREAAAARDWLAPAAFEAHFQALQLEAVITLTYNLAHAKAGLLEDIAEFVCEINAVKAGRAEVVPPWRK